MILMALRKENTWNVVVCFLIPISLMPLLAVETLPLTDYPNHLGRLEIYFQLQRDSVLSQFYEWHWHILPNLALDLLVLPFSSLGEVERTANFIIFLSILLLCCGLVLLDRQLNGRNWGLSLFSGVFLYNGAFQYGFVNYVIGLSVAIPSVALWIAIRHRAYLLRIPIFVLIGVVIFFLHLYAFAIFGLCIGGYELARLMERWRERKRLSLNWLIDIGVVGSIGIIPAILMMTTARTSSDASRIYWGSLWHKIEAMASPVLFSIPVIEIPLLLIVIGALGWGLISGIIGINRRFLIVLGAIGLLFLAMPRILFGSSFADWRLPSAASFLVLASLYWKGGTSQTARRVISGTLSICVIVRVVSILAIWIPAQAVLREYDAALIDIPKGSRLLIIEGTTGSASRDRRPPLTHVAVHAAARREVAVGSLFATTHDGKGAPSVPVWFTRTHSDLYQWRALPSDIENIGKFNYMIAIREPKLSVPAGYALKQVGGGQSFKLYKIERS